jgi:hypothetical protein
MIINVTDDSDFYRLYLGKILFFIEKKQFNNRYFGKWEVVQAKHRSRKIVLMVY